jgi:hypothetical protein
MYVRLWQNPQYELDVKVLFFYFIGMAVVTLRNVAMECKHSQSLD